MTVYYFADNQTGAHANAAVGDNNNAGTSSAAPKRTTAGFNFNALTSGDELRFATGGCWIITAPLVSFGTATADASNPIIVGSYDPGGGVTGKPWIKATLAVNVGVFDAGGFSGTDPVRGGYLVDGFKIEGMAVPVEGSAVMMKAPIRNFTIQNCEVINFWTGIRSYVGAAGATNTHFKCLDNDITGSGFTGWLGAATDCLIEGNDFHHNGSANTQHHGIYYGSGTVANSRTIIRHNTVRDNNLSGGQAVGGNLTYRGSLTDTIIENNLVYNSTGLYAQGSWAISHFAAYSQAESHVRTVIRGNTTVNHPVGIEFGNAPDIIVENNTIIDLSTSGGAFAGIVWTYSPDERADDAFDARAQVRNNTIYASNPRTGSVGIRTQTYGAGLTLHTPGSNIDIVNNLIYFANPPPTGTTNYFALTETSPTSYDSIIKNLCSGGSGWTSTRTTLATFESYYNGLVLNGTTCVATDNIDAAPQFVAVPSAANSWSCQVQSTSPARNAANTTHAPALAADGYTRDVTPDIGSHEQGKNP